MRTRAPRTKSGRATSVDTARRMGFVFSGAVWQSARRAAGIFSSFDVRPRGDGDRTGINRPCSDTKSMRTRAPSGRSPSYISPKPALSLSKGLTSAAGNQRRQRASDGIRFQRRGLVVTAPRIWKISRSDPRSRGDGDRTGINRPCSDTKSMRTLSAFVLHPFPSKITLHSMNSSITSHPLIPLPQIRHPNSNSHPNYSCRIWGRTGGGSDTNHPRIPTTNLRRMPARIRHRDPIRGRYR